MRPSPAFAVFVLVLLIGIAGDRTARAVIVAAPTGPIKAAHADVIVIGKVASVSDKVEATAVPGGKDKISYTVAVIAIDKVLKGDAKEKVLLGLPAGASGKAPAVKLEPGQDGLFFMTKHHDGDFYVLPMAGCFVSAQSKAAFTTERDEAQRTVSVLADPLAGLKAKDASKRLDAIYLLLTVYRTAPLNVMCKLESIPEEESHLILKGLLDADWNYDNYKGANYKQYPGQLFNLLALTQKEGFQKPGQGILTPEYAAAARKWLEKNWETFRVQKVVITPDKASS